MNRATVEHYKFSPQYFKPYYLNNRMLFQFILSEFIFTSYKIQGIQQRLTELKPSWATMTSPQVSQTLQDLVEQMSRLSGSSQHYMRLLSWNDDGFLTKLKNYCALLCQQNTSENSDQLKMHQEANHAWLLSMQALDMIRTFSNQGTFDEEILYANQEKLNRCLQRLSRLIMRHLLHYQDDENVVYFLVRHKKQLDGLYKPGYTANLIKKMFPKGKQDVSQFLLQRYAERGFDSLLPTIQTELTELKSK